MEPLYLDNHLLVINKPAGLLSQADKTGDTDVLTLWKAWIKDRFDKPGNVFLGLVHRLDRPASGVMVLARTSKAASRLSDQFRQREPEKWYTAIVEGNPGRQGSYTDYLLKTGSHVRCVDQHTRGARSAELSWFSLLNQDGLTVVAVRLKTGRSHQIRVQFSSRGFPLLGDMRYGAKRELDGRNLALHARRLVVWHPTREERMEWESVEPATWPGTMRGLEFEPR